MQYGLFAKYNYSRRHPEIFFYYFSEEIRLDISCESSAFEMQSLIFSEKIIIENLDCLLLQYGLVL